MHYFVSQLAVPHAKMDTTSRLSCKLEKLANGEISKEEYDEWRYKYPELDTYQHWAKVPSQEISDMLMEEFRKAEAEEKKEAKRKKKK
jgi:hypothetical protein